MTVKLDIKLQRNKFLLNVKLKAPPGVTVIFGPSGSGKTTLLRVISGLETATQGDVSIDGVNLLGVPPHRRAVGYVFQEPRLFPHLNVLGNLKFPQRMSRGFGLQSLGEVIDLLELEPLLHCFPSVLSGGEAQRIALGRALVSNPKCLCLDEPLSALDQALKERILPYLERLKDKIQIPILYVTHDAAEMARLADNIVLMRNGSNVLSGLVDDVLSDPTAVPFLGVRSAGTVVSARVMPRDPISGLAVVSFAGGKLFLPELLQQEGSIIRIRIAAQDIILALRKPKEISALNILSGQISRIHQGQGPGVMVQFKVGKTLFLARLTQYSATRMDLKKGQNIFAIIKVSAFDPAGIGT
jgi:molybdate transport system ATP-binding protein